MYSIHNGGKRDTPCCNEMASNSTDSKVTKAVADIVMDALDVKFGERRIVGGLLYTSLKPHFEQRDRLLEQYLHTQLDIIADKMRKKFKVKGEVNYNHTTHAKFNDLFAEIEKLISDK